MAPDAPVSRSTSERRTHDAETFTSTARSAAESFGAFLLVLGGVGTAVFASSFPDDGNALGVGFVGVALAFGLSVTAGIYAVGHVSGGHVNPAVTLGLAIAGRAGWRHVPGYVVAQVVGGTAGAAVVTAVAADGPVGYLAAARDSGFASNGFDAASPGGFGLGAVLLVEVVLTAVFVGVILSVTAKNEYKALAPLAIGFTLTLIHLVSIPVSNTSVNPARSIAAALFAGPEALGQLWAFVLAPLVGAALAGVAHRSLRAGARGVRAAWSSLGHGRPLGPASTRPPAPGRRGATERRGCPPSRPETRPTLMFLIRYVCVTFYPRMSPVGE